MVHIFILTFLGLGLDSKVTTLILDSKVEIKHLNLTSLKYISESTADSYHSFNTSRVEIGSLNGNTIPKQNIMFIKTTIQ